MNVSSFIFLIILNVILNDTITTSNLDQDLIDSLSNRDVLIRSKSSKLCLQERCVKKCHVIQAFCHGSITQRWAMFRLKDTFGFINSFSSNAIDMPHGSKADGMEFVTWVRINSFNQIFHIHRKDDLITYKLVNVNSGKCMEIGDYIDDDESRVIQETCKDDPNQDWEFILILD